jgi:hypothetical protein
MKKQGKEIEFLFRRVAALWEEAVEQDLANSNEVSFDAFLGAQYSIASLAGQCTVTEDGIKVVELALKELQQLGENDQEDGDE